MRFEDDEDAVAIGCSGSEQMVDLFASWVEKYPMIVSIEDPLDQDDWAGYAALTKVTGAGVRFVGDDFPTSPTPETNWQKASRGGA